MLAVGDVASLVGSPRDVERVVEGDRLPHTAGGQDGFSYSSASACSAGFAVGLLGVPFGGALLGLGTGGGCLITGLVFGWLRARRPTFGQLPAAAALYLKDFGLSVFVACIGLATGPGGAQADRPLRRSAAHRRNRGFGRSGRIRALLRQVRAEDAPGAFCAARSAAARRALQR